MIRVYSMVVAVCLVACAGVTRSRASSVVMAPSKDNTIFSDGGTVSLGAGQYLFSSRVGSNGGGHLRRALLAFDVASAIPPGSTITSVVLRLNLSKTVSGDSMHTLHRVQRDWGEGASTGFSSEEGSGGNAVAGDATWLHTFATNGLWTTAGGDFEAVASAGQIVGVVGPYVWSSTQLVADVQHWLDTPSANAGWILIGDEVTLNSAKRFDSRQHASEANRPALFIGYDDPPPPPPLGPIVLAARLDGAQQVPLVVSAASGIALVSYAHATRTLTWYVQHSVTNVTMAHIHGPAGEGTNGPVVVNLGAPLSPIRGTAVLTGAQEMDLFNGRYYINVHSGGFPSGEIRGQLLARAAYAGILEGAQEVPAAATAASGAVVMEYNPATGQLDTFVEHSVLNASAAHMHGPALPGVNAGVLVNLGLAANPIQHSAILSVPDAAALAKGFCYVNVHSPTFPAGELRGQLQALNAVPAPTLAALLNAAQQVPVQTNAYRGAASVTFDRATRRLRVRLAHNVEGATMAHIHGPAGEGTNAPVVFDLGVPVSPLEGDFTLTPAQAEDLLRGRYYFNVHNVDNPAGAIRGQILPRAVFTAVLNGAAETPRRTVWNHGVGHFLYDHATRQLTYTIVHSMTNVTAAHIHGPADPGIAAGVRYHLAAPSPMTGSVTVLEADVPALLAGRLYVNVHSPAYPAGEIRGHLVQAEAVPTATHAAVLSGAEEVPPVPTLNSGLAIASYDCATRLLQVDIRHTITNPISAHIHGPAGVGTNAGVIFGFPVPESPILASIPLTAAQGAAFRSGLYYVNVHSPTNPTGELRGQLLPTTWRLAATLQGRQETARVPTAAAGQGLFRYDPATQILSYRIEHTLATATAGHIHGPAAPGFNAGVVHGFALPQSPITGQVILTADQAIALLRGHYYVNLHSSAFPGGELRGQIQVTLPDTDCNRIDDHWELQHGLTPGGYDPQADNDGDGHSVWQEFVADTAPTSAASVALIDVDLNTVTIGTSPFRTYQVQQTTNLVTGVWENVGTPFAGTGNPMPVNATNAAPASFYRHTVFLP